MDVEAAARAWSDGWREAWLAEDADAVAALYADDAVFVSQPFRGPHSGSAGARAYAESAFRDETALDVRFGDPFVVDGERAVVEYWALLDADGREVTLAGVALVQFADDGKVVRQRDYWAMEDGRREPPHGWGA